MLAQLHDYHFYIDSLSSFYSLTGRPAVYQIEMLRSLIFMTHFRYVSIKKWVAKLNNDKCLAALCGFNPSHIPQVSSYYDFFNHFWNEDKKSHLLPSHYFR